MFHASGSTNLNTKELLLLVLKKIVLIEITRAEVKYIIVNSQLHI